MTDQPTLVVKLSGSVAEDPNTLQALADDVRALHDAGIVVFLVHGGGPQLDAALAAIDDPGRRHEGLRITSAQAAAVVQETLDGVGERLANALEEVGVAAAHVPSNKGLFEATVKDLGDGVDLGRVGTLTAFHHRFVQPVLPGEPVGVLTPVGLDEHGPLNINADEGAAGVAAAVGADRLVLATNVDAVLGPDGEPVHAITPASAAALVDSGAIAGGMTPKLEAALAAVEAGVGQVLIGRVGPGTLRAFAIDGEAEGTVVAAEGVPA